MRDSTYSYHSKSEVVTDTEWNSNCDDDKAMRTIYKEGY